MSIWTDGTGIKTVKRLENDGWLVVESITDAKGKPVEVNKYGERVGDRFPVTEYEPETVRLIGSKIG